MVKEQLSVQLWNRSPIELYALTWLADAPLSSVEDLTATAGFTQQEWTRALARLTKDGEVEALPLGASRDMTPRYVLTMSGLRHILEWFPQKVPWSASAAGVKGIATRLAFAEQIYRMAPTLLDPKRLCVPYANAIGLQAKPKPR